MRVFWTGLFIVSILPCYGQQKPDYQQERMNMVEEQLVSRNVSNPRVLNAMRKVERHLFVPSNIVQHAYQDQPLPIGMGQTISQPYIVAFMTQVLKLRPDDRVLEIGTGSGYQAAILGELCREVFTIELIPELASSSKALLLRLGYENVHVKSGDGYLGWPDMAPFDAIIVTCAPNNIPEPLENQLTEGGRMIIPAGRTGAQQLILITKSNGELKKKAVMNVRFVPMLDPQGIKY